jgi:choline kinase
MEILLSQPESKFKEKIISIVLCAGEGTRAKKIAENVPKPLLKVESLNNQSILSFIISNLKELNLDLIVVVTGHLGKQIADFLNSFQLKDQHGKENIMIHSSGNRYKQGPLHSFLSITTDSQIFKDDKIFMVLPGDTVFDYALLQEILDSLNENFLQVIHNSIIFYRKIRTEILKERFERYFPIYEKSISHLKIEKKDSKAIVKEIVREKVRSISSEEVVNQIVPIFIFNNAYVNEIKDLAKLAKFRSIRDVINLMIKRKKEFLALSVNPEYNFYDIDTPLDLEILNEKKKDGQ